MKERLDIWLEKAFEKSASDVHIAIGKAPVFRVNGELIEQNEDKLSSADTKQLVKAILPENRWEELEIKREVDFTYSIHGLSRFRVNTYYQRGGLSIAIRLIPEGVPSLEELKLPAILKEIAKAQHGLVLVTGPTGSGKSTTLAAMINDINQTAKRHIITLEDPIEYMHTHQMSIIDQREVGFDTNSFASGLRAALRQDPDVILVGEMRDLETISTAITAAETGHLVLGTLHTADSVSTIERMIDVFPPDQQDQIRIQLANILNAVISQRLFSKDAIERRAVTEILINTPAVKNLIRNEKLHQIQNVLQTSKEEGMHTLEMELTRLLKENEIDFHAAAPFLTGNHL